MALVSSSSSPFPSSGRELLLELKRTGGGRMQTTTSTSSSSYLPPYNIKLVRNCFQDLQKSFQSLQEEMAALDHGRGGGGEGDGNDDDDNDAGKPSMNSRPSILFHNSSIQRQKRCLLAYHKHRMDTIQELQKSNNTTTDQQQMFQNAQEAEFAAEYKELREKYATAIFELDTLPPTSHMVQVRVVQDLGQVVLESGRSIAFCKGSSLYLPRTDVLEFLQSGSLELVDGEEIDF